MNTHLEFDRTIRIAVIRHLIDKGRAPEVRDLAAAYDCADEQVEASFHRLHEHHGLVLHPHGSAAHPAGRRIWLAHPFSTAPTHFYVERAATNKARDSNADVAAATGWWANCAKCALGVAAILNDDAIIHTRIAGEAEPLTFEIRSGRPTRRDLVMHVALPVAQWWENVCYTCSTILFFRDERQVAAWSAAHGINHGAVVPIEKAWDLARLWYGSALQPDWRRKTGPEAAALFEELGLTGEFWRVPETWK